MVLDPVIALVMVNKCVTFEDSNFNSTKSYVVSKVKSFSQQCRLPRRHWHQGDDNTSYFFSLKETIKLKIHGPAAEDQINPFVFLI